MCVYNCRLLRLVTPSSNTACMYPLLWRQRSRAGHRSLFAPSTHFQHFTQSRYRCSQTAPGIGSTPSPLSCSMLPTTPLIPSARPPSSPQCLLALTSSLTGFAHAVERECSHALSAHHRSAGSRSPGPHNSQLLHPQTSRPSRHEPS